ncbi:NADH:flavin oxidoreductase, partial [Planctomycetota bacterium]
WLDRAGLDLIEVSGGCPASGKRGAARAKIDSPEKEGYLRDLAAKVKKVVTVPVITVGGYRSVEVAEEVLRSGCADAVALSRPLICEPELPARWASGDRSRSRCAGCQRCFGTAYKGALECVTRTDLAFANPEAE